MSLEVKRKRARHSPPRNSMRYSWFIVRGYLVDVYFIIARFLNGRLTFLLLKLFRCVRTIGTFGLVECISKISWDLNSSKLWFFLCTTTYNLKIKRKLMPTSCFSILRNLLHLGTMRRYMKVVLPTDHAMLEIFNPRLSIKL